MKITQLSIRRLTVSTALTSTCALFMIGGFSACEKKADFSSDKGKASYAIGIQIGKSLKSQNADVDLSSLHAGLSDAVAGKEPGLKPEEMQAAMMKLQEASMKKAAEVAEQNAKLGETYLEKNKAKAGIKTTDSGLQYEVVKDGSGAKPKAGDMVKVHYTGTLTTGEKFDSSVDRGEPATFPVDGVIPGWTEALKMMATGSKWKLTIPAKLAYGPQGRPGIPPNSVLLFDVELLDVNPPKPPGAGGPGGDPGMAAAMAAAHAGAGMKQPPKGEKGKGK
jgi:FKBP-type peptidyl-prolyl cis-trans isomerase